jgi:hypothetical protein
MFDALGARHDARRKAHMIDNNVSQGLPPSGFCLEQTWGWISIDKESGGSMDEQKVQFFLARYGSLTGDELAALYSRRNTLSDEASAALEAVLSDRGIDPVVLARFSNAADTYVHVLSEEEINAQLVQSRLALFLKLIFVITVWSTTELALTKFAVHPAVILVVWSVVVFSTYKLAGKIVRLIANENASSLRQKRQKIWGFIVINLTAFFLLFSSLATVRQIT